MTALDRMRATLLANRKPDTPEPGYLNILAGSFSIYGARRQAVHPFEIVGGTITAPKLGDGQ